MDDVGLGRDGRSAMTAVTKCMSKWLDHDIWQRMSFQANQGFKTAVYMGAARWECCIYGILHMVIKSKSTFWNFLYEFWANNCVKWDGVWEGGGCRWAQQGHCHYLNDLFDTQPEKILNELSK